MPENLFEKIDKQSKTIDSVADKLDGVSINDLYALAKRTWDYKDYQMAQKYYNHISLLRPIDWEAPFCASLCGCMTPESIYLWDRRPKEISAYYQATIEYIQGRAIDDDEKQKQIIEATEIILSVLKEYIRIYAIPDNRENFEKFAPKFKIELQKSFINVIRKIDSIPFTQSEIREKLCLECGEFIEKYCQDDKSISITRDDFEKYILPYNNRITYAEAIYEEPDPEKVKEIKLKGKCYLEYKDKVIEKRYRRKNLIFGIILFLSGGFDIFLLSGSNAFVVALLIGLISIGVSTILLMRGWKPIKQDSLINHRRWRYRLASNGDVVCEEVPSLTRLLSHIFQLFYFFSHIYLFMFALNSIGNEKETIFGIKIIVLALTSLAGWIGTFAFTNLGYASRYEYKEKFIYQGKTYYLD